MKKLNIIRIVIVLLFMILCTTIGKDNIYALTTEYASVSDYSIDEEHSFRPRFTSETRVTMYPTSGTWTEATGWDSGSYSLDKNHWSKGNVYAIYTNVGVYKGQKLDMKVTYTNWDGKEIPLLAFARNTIGGGYAKNTRDTFGTYETNYITVKVEFLKSGTREVVSVTGHDIVYDLDSFERWEAGNNIEKVILDKSQEDEYVEVRNGLLGSTTGASGSNDGTSFAITYSGTSYTFNWRGCHWSLGDGPLFRIEVPTPEKSVSTTTANIGSSVNYVIEESVPNESKEFYYSSWVMSDSIPSCLSWGTSNVSVTNESGSNVTSNFNIRKSGNTLTVTAKNVNSADFYGHAYSIKVNTKVTSSNLDDYTVNNGTILGNQAILRTDRGEKRSNQVTTEVKYKITTSIDHGAITNSNNSVKGGSNQTITFKPQRGYYISRIVVDGVDQDVNRYDILGDSYTFSKVTNDHSIQVYTQPMKLQIKIDKQDIETNKSKNGDAVISGAEYGIYSDSKCTDLIEKLTVDNNGYATSSELLLVEYSNGNYVYHETYYVKEIKAPTGYNIDTNVYTVYQNTATQNVKVATQTVTSKERVIKNDIEIIKNLEKTDSTLKQNLSGVVFKATLDSDPSKVYYSTETDSRGYCIIEDLPYGTYTIIEMKIPGVAFDGNFYIGNSSVRVTLFKQFIQSDSSKSEPYRYSDITNVAKKMQIVIYKEDAETGTTTQGDAHLEGAEYTIYRDENCTDAVETVTIQKGADGKYSATSGWYLVGTYYVKETKAPEGYLIDEKVYPVVQDPAGQTTEYTTHTITSKDYVIRNDIEIVKNLEETDSTEKQSLAGAVFSATLNSDNSKVYYSTVTDDSGYCIIEDLPYGTYTVRESTIPDTAYNGEFYIGNSQDRATIFEQFIEVDDGENAPYRYGDITDVAKKMQIVIYKEDAETGTTTQGDAHLEGAEYTIYRDEDCTDAVETVTIAKNEDGTYSATSGWYLVGTYYVKETKAPEGYLIDEKVYPVVQVPAEQTTEYTTHTITSKEYVIRNHIEIVKNLEETDSTEKQSLAGAVFSATLNSDTSKVYYSTVTDDSGYCIIEDLPYGTYTLRESTIPDVAYNGEFYVGDSQDRVTTFEQFIQIDKTQRDPYRYDDITDVAKKMRIIINKEDDETGIHTQGDAHLEGAEYTIYRDETCTDAVETITIAKNEDGTYSATSGWYLVGKYYVKETKAPEGYNIDEKVYPVEQIPAQQTEEFSTHNVLSKDKVMEGIVRIIKYNNNSSSTDKEPAVGSKVRLTLNSNPNVYYEAIVDENGYAEFVDVVDDTHFSSTETHCYDTCYPYTIPYGVYTISEVQSSNSGENIFIDKQETEIKYQDQTQRHILDEEYVRMRLTINKIDSETGEVIPGNGTFKIWDVNNQKWYEEMLYPSGEYISEFTTNDKGELTINRHLEAGSYVLYEVQAPYGYYLDDDLRVDSIGYEFTIGVEKNGDVSVWYEDTKQVLQYEVEDYDNIPTKLYSWTALIKDPPQKAIIKITDIASQFTTVNIEENEYGNVNKPIFEDKGLEGVEFDIIAKENIYTPEGTKRYSKGEVVSHIKTDEDGVAQSVEIYLGKYEVVQTNVPEGYILDKAPIDLDIVYTNQYERVQIIPLEIRQESQEVKLSFEKVFNDLEYSKFKFETKYATFGIYTNETIKNYKGENTIGIDELVDVITTDENNMLSNNIQLPEGNYYVKELNVSNPYKLINYEFEFKVEYVNNSDQTINVTVNNGKIENEAEIVELELLVYPEPVYDELGIENIKDREELEDIAKENGIADKTYGVYLDEECKNPVMTIDNQEAQFTTNEYGIINIPDMPTGIYYFKERVAPYGYELSEEVIEAKIDGTEEILILTAKEPLKKAKLLQKYDTFTKDYMSGVRFEITDEDDNLIYSGYTNEEGILEVPIIYFENGEKYYYKEVSAPDMYQVEEEEKEFIAEYDEEKCEWKLEIIEVGNDRKTIDQVILRKTDRETGEPLQGCEFTIVLLDENGEEYVNQKGEKVYLVEKGLTNEEGEYIIENVPYGTYRFIEIKAPEGYELDEDITGLEFTVDENSGDTLIFEVTNTGDIAVVAIVGIAALSIVGIVFVIKRKKVNI